ncbi:MAG: PRC-barrel domain-containing protein [Armatimonadetes bacterium]|nr:PRC-barrel domain-containing protein [Armatimonadota bacterium]
MARTALTHPIWLSRELLDSEVFTRKGERLGVIDNIQLDLAAGHVSYLVLRVAAGRIEKRVVLPWHILRFEGKAITANLDLQRLLEATEPERMPRVPVDNWRQEVFEYGSPRGNRRPAPSMKVQDLQPKTPEAVRVGMLRAVLGMKLRNRRGERLGRLEEVAVDVRTGHVACAGIVYGGVLRLARRLYAVPWQMFEGVEARELLLAVERETLETAPDFRVEDVRRSEWLDRLHAQFQTAAYWTVRDPVAARRA